METEAGEPYSCVVLFPECLVSTLNTGDKRLMVAYLHEDIKPKILRNKALIQRAKQKLMS